MQIGAIQERTGSVLTRARPDAFPDGYVAELRHGLEELLRALELREALWLSKGRLDDFDRCEGTFAADLAGERGPFEYGFKAAVGAVVHRAVQADVASEGSLDPRTLVDHALEKQLSDRRLLAHWTELADVERHEILAEAARQLALFREMFPPLERRAQPISEQRLQVRLLDGRVSLFGKPDLLLGRPPSIVVDFKTGEPRPEHVEDGRFYALLLTLMFERPAALAATAYLDSLELQPEEIEPHVLERAVDRVVDAAAFAARPGETVRLHPGAHCSWCPRAETCPANRDREDGLE